MNTTHQYHGTVDIHSDVYWKLYRCKEGHVTVVCMQWFDEPDYFQEQFIRNDDGEVHVFETEDMAAEKLNAWFKPEEIDSEYLRSSDNVRNDE